MKLKNPFKRKDIPFKVEEGNVITKAFYINGVQYYQLHDLFNSFCSRGMDGLSIYEEWNMRCSRSFLIEHTKAVNAILRNPKNINVIDIAYLNDKLMERLEWALPTEEIMWRFMAIAFFDENESPYKYDSQYGIDKIKRWKESNKIEDFFLAIPLKNLIPIPDFSAADLTLLTGAIAKMDKKHIELVTSILSSNQQNNGSSPKQSSVRNTASTPLN